MEFQAQMKIKKLTDFPESIYRCIMDRKITPKSFYQYVDIFKIYAAFKWAFI